MRISEVGQDASIDKFVIALRNHIGRAASQHVPAKLNWEAVGQMSRANGFEFAADYETFKSMYDNNPIIQGLVKNFNSQGIVLNVPGTSDKSQQTNQPKKDSQSEVDKIAASNAEANLGDSVDPRVKLSKGDKIQLNWTRKGNDTGVITGVGADYIKFKLDNDTSPHGDTAAVYFNEFKKYKVRPLRNLGDSKEMNQPSIVENLRRQLSEISAQDERLLKKYGISKDKVTLYQVKQHKEGNKISWEEAKNYFVNKAKADEKAARAAERKANPKPRAPRQASGMTASQFKKMMKGAAQDFQADFADTDQDLSDVAWDLAGSMMYDPDVKNFVIKTIARNSGRRPEEIAPEEIQEYIADEIHNAGTNEEYAVESDDFKTRQSINGLKRQINAKVADYKKTKSDIKRNHIKNMIDQLTSELQDIYDQQNANEEYTAEISNDLKQRYKEKSQQVVKDVKPFTKKGEYRDLAKRLVARREKGLSKVGEARMPSSVIKVKQKLANMSPEEFAQHHGDKSEDALRQMAWRHGYGKMSDFYVKKLAAASIAESTDIADFGTVSLTQYAGKEGLMMQITTGYEKYIQLNKEDAAKVAQALAAWAKSVPLGK